MNMILPHQSTGVTYKILIGDKKPETRPWLAKSQHRKARFVLMAIEDFERLTAGNPDPRRAYRAEDTPPELAKLIGEGLDRIIAGSDEADGQ
jgi:hypothetical protein